MTKKTKCLISFLDQPKLKFFSLAYFLVISLLFVFKITAVSTIGYKMDDFQNKIKILTRENRVLAVQIAENSSVSVLHERLVLRDFAPAPHAAFLAIENNPTVAVK